MDRCNQFYITSKNEINEKGIDKPNQKIFQMIWN